MSDESQNFRPLDLQYDEGGWQMAAADDLEQVIGQRSVVNDKIKFYSISGAQWEDLVLTKLSSNPGPASGVSYWEGVPGTVITGSTNLANALSGNNDAVYQVVQVASGGSNPNDQVGGWIVVSSDDAGHSLTHILLVDTQCTYDGITYRKWVTCPETEHYTASPHSDSSSTWSEVWEHIAANLKLYPFTWTEHENS